MDYFSAPNLSPLDVDECREFGGGCQYQCQNTRGGFVCHCMQGQTLHIDGKSCICEYTLSK